jgi:spermidine/putrescine transport system substrate-binding protein
MVKISSRVLFIGAAIFIAASVSITLWVILYRPRTSVLKIYNWEDYIEEDLIKEFQTYYREKSGDKKFKVKYDTFTDNEELLTKIETQGRDYDIAFPSEYMVEKLLAKDLLKPIDTANEIFTNYANLDTNITAKVNSYAKPSNDLYAVPYIYGTLGIMYDEDELTAAEITKLTNAGWQSLWGEVGSAAENAEWQSKFKGKITMKKSARDTIGAAMLYIADKNGAMSGDISKALNIEGEPYTLEKAKEVLELQRRQMAPAFENDEGKELFANADNHQFAYGLYWSVDAGLAMGENPKLKYFTPTYTNFWIDNFVLPTTGTKDEKTTRAAYEFINFMLNKSNAVRNMNYVGSAMAIGGAQTEYTAHIDELKKSGEISATEHTHLTGSAFLTTMFPSSNQMGSYGAVMKNFAEKTEKSVNDLMIQVMLDAALDEGEGSNLLWLWITLAVVAAGGLGYLTYWLLSRRRMHAAIPASAETKPAAPAEPARK